jgi:hypothetical protein
MTALTLAQASPWYDLPILSPYAIAIANLTTVSSQVLAADNARTGVFFHNPGTANKRIMPAGSVLAGGAQITGIGMGSMTALAADPNRKGVQFYNPSDNTLGVCPDNLGATIGAGSILLYPGLSKTIIGNDRVRVNCGWNVTANAGGANQLTALQFYG